MHITVKMEKRKEEESGKKFREKGFGEKSPKD